MKYYAGIDLGGTNIAVGIVDENFAIVSKASAPSLCPRPGEDLAADMAKVTLEAVENAKLTMDDIEWVGIGCPGTIGSDGSVIYANNLDFYNVPLGKYIHDILKKDIYVTNDANAAAFGEYIAGAAKGAKNALAITLGTGVGGGIIIDGKIYTGTYGGAGELGHICIEYKGRHCTCGRDGCLEAYASATGIIKMSKEAMAEDKNSAMWEICGGDISKVNGKTAFDAMRKNDKAGTEVVKKYIDYLACGVASFMNIFEPEILCIGGGISKEGDTLIKPLTDIVNGEMYARYAHVKANIVTAKLGNDAGIIGAAFLGSQKK